MPLATYKQRLSTYRDIEEKLSRKLVLLSTLRLTAFLSTIMGVYLYFAQDISIAIALILLAAATFFYLLKTYDNENAKRELFKALVKINDREIKLLEGEKSTAVSGEEFTDPHHPYSHDLDLFGDGSLYQFLNRTTHVFGASALANSLLHPVTAAIKERQEAIKELSQSLEFRQQVQAHGMIHGSEEKKIERLKKWLEAPPAFSSKTLYYFLLIFPLLTVACSIAYLVTEDPDFKTIAGLGIVINLGITASYAKKMMSYIGVSSDINETLQQFAGQLQTIESQKFTAASLSLLQKKLFHGNYSAGKSIKSLATSFNYLDYVFNIFLSPFINGLFLFHVRTLYKLDQWKLLHKAEVLQWLEVCGEMEAMNSLATFHYNNPETNFPHINETEGLEATGMGHPLIKASKRIVNDISFNQQRFVILTGSNMSGKSTFLRTLGINLILARAGSAATAQHFEFYPYDVFVSMRITDSLQDSESFFYAELKRLRQIIEHLNAGNKTFILLDEILRGTNSDDKHSGTVGLIRQLTANKATGIIATHDLTVALLTKEYPEQLSAKCFESEIINDELLFDYKIKEGVCTKLSASFLMRKLGIIK